MRTERTRTSRSGLTTNLPRSARPIKNLNNDALQTKKFTRHGLLKPGGQYKNCRKCSSDYDSKLKDIVKRSISV